MTHEVRSMSYCGFGTMEQQQDDEEIEQLLGEIPRATSAPPHPDDNRAADPFGFVDTDNSNTDMNTNTNNTNVMDNLLSVMHAQKQRVLLLQLQLEEERRRQQQQQQQHQQLQLTGLQSQALLAAAVAPSTYRTVRRLVHSDPDSTSQQSYGSGHPVSLCRYYAQGYCSRGELCPYLHIQLNQRARTVTSMVTTGKPLVTEKINIWRGAAQANAAKKKAVYVNGEQAVLYQAQAALGQMHLGGSYNVHAPKYTSLKEVEGRIYSIAKDQHGCRFLQRKFDEGGAEELQKIFAEIIDHIVGLMTDPFGNYLVQKLLDVCSEFQRLEILRVVCSGDQLVTISLNIHGTRAVQKLIDTVKTPEQVSMIISSLKLGVVTLIKDLNGNHVVQRCLQCLGSVNSQFIFDAAAQHCVEIATHRHGCCVLQRCVHFARGMQKERLVAEIAANALVLSQDQYGNYVVQYILDEGMWVSGRVMARLEGSYAHLAMQKFSSNVVEKCLKQGNEESRARIVHELTSSDVLGQLLQDPYANYVIQCALSVTKGEVHGALVEAIRPHLSALRSSPYGKRILCRTNLKKT